MSLFEKWNIFVASRVNEPYANIGQWADWAALQTGDPKYDQIAIGWLIKNWPTLNQNNTREHTMELARLYGELRREMSEEERSFCVGKLAEWAEAILRDTNDGDSDEVVGSYFGLRMVDKVLGTTYCNRPALHGNMTAHDMRKTIRSYIAKAKGGEWIEAGQKYNYGTMSLLLLGVSLLDSEDPNTEFPEVMAWLPEVAEQLVWHHTADGKETVQWGDCEDPHHPALYQFVTLAAQIVELLGDYDGPLAHLLACRIKGLAVGEYGNNLHRPLWSYFNPDGLPKNPVWPNPQGMRVSNTGLVLYRKGDTLVQFMLPNEIGVDHRVHACNLRVYDGGEWVIDAPLGYSYQMQLHNGPRGFGFGSMYRRQLASCDERLDGDGFVAVWSSGENLRGPWAGNNQPNYPSGFVHNMRMRVEYEHSTRSLKIRCAFLGEEPDFAATGGPALSDEEREIIKSAPATWQYIHHCRTEPKVLNNGWFWETKGGRGVELHSDAPLLGAEKLVDNVNVRGTYSPEELEGWMMRCMANALPDAVFHVHIGWDEHPFPQPLPTPEPIPEPIPQPEPVPEPVPTPEPVLLGEFKDEAGNTYLVTDRYIEVTQIVKFRTDFVR